MAICHCGRTAETALSRASHLQADRGQTIGIAVDEQLSQKDTAEIRYLENAAEWSAWKLVASFLDSSFFYYGTEHAVSIFGLFTVPLVTLFDPIRYRSILHPFRKVFRVGHVLVLIGDPGEELIVLDAGLTGVAVAVSLIADVEV